MSRRSQHSNEKPVARPTTTGSYSSSTGQIPDEVNISEVNEEGATYECSVQNFESMTGPIPSPRALKGYAELDPSLPDRIVSMAEKQLDHEISMDKRNAATTQEAMRRGFASAKRGQWMGFSIIGILIGCSIWMGLVGHETLSFVMIGSGITAAGAALIKNLFKKE